MPDAITCREQIVSEDYMDFITSLSRKTLLDELITDDSVCRMLLGGPFHAVFLDKELIGERNLSQFPYYAIPKCYTLLDTEAMNQAGIIPIQNYPGLQLMGEGILVGIVDTGIEYTNAIFRSLDGASRIVRLWDQTLTEGVPPAEFGYGAEFTKEQLDEALKSPAPLQVVPSTDTNGHGTFLASLACGNANAENRFVGAAPESSIAVVKLKEAKQYLRDYYYVDADAPCYQENDIMTGVRYLHELAYSLDMPLVICVALGTNMGGHRGASPLAGYLELLSNVNGRAIVLGTGNEADKRHHYMGTLTGETVAEEIEIRVGNNTRGFTMELWTEIPNIFEVTIVSPSGERIGRVRIRQGEGIYNFVFEVTQVYVATRLLVERTSAELIFMQFDRPTAGIWKLIIEPVQIGSGIFHIWLPVTEFLTGEVYFLRSNPDYTITEPGNTVSAITAAYYNGQDNSIAVSSGRGYTRLERIKPDFAAPGVNVTGMNARGQFTARTGSSVGTAVTAGACALMMEWLDRLGESFDSNQLKSLLILGTQRRPGITYPNREWGYGTLNLFETFEVLRRF